MAITTLNRYDSSPSTIPQRPYDEVYQTPRFNTAHPYRNGQARLAQSRHLWQDDPNCSGVSHLQNFSHSPRFSGKCLSPSRFACNFNVLLPWCALSFYDLLSWSDTWGK